jgi:hypothetical protein
VVGAQEEKHEEGSYCIRHKKSWIDVDTDPLAAQRMRSKLVDQTEYTAVQPVGVTKGTSLAQASERYFTNLEARGLDAKSIRTYRAGVDPFVQTCKKACVEDVTKQDMIDFMGWLRKQPLPTRRNSNPERTYSNKVGYVAIFLKEFGVSRLLKKKEYPRYHKKKVIAHPDDELSLLYGHANAEERFLLDFFIGSMVRDHEGYGSRYSDLTGVTLTIRGKQHKTRPSKSVQGLPGKLTNVASAATPNISFSTARENRTSICFRTCRALPRKRGRNSTRNYINCARREPEGVISKAWGCRR